jgi:hypothetical protein
MDFTKSTSDKKGIEGYKISQMMVDLRENPLKEINGQRVIMVEDYQSSAAQLIR